MKEESNAYEETLDSQLKEWSAQIELLKARAEKAEAKANAKAKAKPEYYTGSL